MSQVTHWVEVEERLIWAVPSPSTYVEVGEALKAAVDFCKKSATVGPFDDDVMVESDEEQIRFVVTRKRK